VNNAGRYGAGIVVYYAGATIRNNVIANNTGGEDYGGAGIWISSNGPSPKVIENNTVSRNSSSLDGGGILVRSTSVTLRNNIVWGNTAPTGPNIRLRPGGNATVSYCDVQGGFTGIGNIDLDPLFADTSFYLQPPSPCVDAGDTAASFNDPPDPINSSLARWPARGTRRNDMGAYGGPGSNEIAGFLTAVDEDGEQAPQRRFILYQNYPNPFNPETNIKWHLPATGGHGGQTGIADGKFVSLKVFDVLGREVATLVNEVKPPGEYSVSWNASGFPSGMYICRLSAGGYQAARKILLVK
jgi:hypothetical protein